VRASKHENVKAHIHQAVFYIIKATVEDRLSGTSKHRKHTNSVIIEGRFGIVQQKIICPECPGPDQLRKNRVSGVDRVPDIPDKRSYTYV
jgi:hypothetical protein